jgi:uncharacterized protein (TIGR03437 family)
MQRILTPAVVLLFGVALNAQTPTPIYNTIPAPLPPSLPSRSFEGNATSEFGNRVGFAGTSRRLASVTVTMVTWGYHSKYPNTPGPNGWNHDITLNLYSVNNSDLSRPGSQIGTITQTFLIPWRPEPAPQCGGTLWLAPDGGCNNGMAFNITFDFSGLSLTLPDQVIFGVAYNTQSFGQNPIGQIGPYNDLNVGLNPTVTAGSNLSAPQAYVNSTAGGGTLVLSTGGGFTNIAAEFNVAAPAPASITATGGGIQNAAVGTQFGYTLQAKVTDAGGNALAGQAVAFSVPVSGASATLSASSVMTDSSGVASVTATANAIPGAYAVTASVMGVALSATFNLTNLAGPAQTVSFTQQPTGATAGSTLAPPVVVFLADTHQNPIAGAPIVLGVENAAAPLHGTVTQTTDSTGHATFSDLSISIPGTYNLQAAANGLTTISSSFQITAGSAVSIAISAGDGQTTHVGTAFAAPVAAVVRDVDGNPIPDASVTFSAPANGPGVTFAGSTTVTTNQNGIAISPALTANSQTGTFHVEAITTGAPSGAIFTLTNVGGTTNTLAFVQPAAAAAGSGTLPSVTVQLQDSQGNAVHTSGIAITLELVPAQTLSGTTTQNTDANGLATFADLSVQRFGEYQLLALAGSVVSTSSNLFDIVVGVPTAILASGGTPQSAITRTAFGAPLQATVTDVAGNPVSGVAVVFAAPTSGATGLFGGQSTITVATDDHGHASAVIAANGIAGSYGVTASSSSITGFALFSLTNLPVGSSSLAFVQQPTNTAAGQVINPPVTVRVQDASGQPVSVAGVPVALSLSSGAGALLGTLVQLTDPTGLATFNDLHIAETGTKRLRVTANDEIPVDSNTFQIIAGAAASITAVGGTPQSVTVPQQFSSPPQAQVKDSAGNPVSGVSVTFTAPPSGPSGTFAGAVTVTTQDNGIATAPPLTANHQVGSFTVTATAAGTASPAVFALTNLPPQTSTIVVDNTQLSFTSEINQPAPPGQIVQITSTVSWTVSSSASWLSASPVNGSASGPITVSVNPAGLAATVYTGSIRIAGSDGSVAPVLVTYTITDKPSLVITPHILVFSTGANAVTPAQQTLTASSTSRPIAYHAEAQVSTPVGGSWLQVSSPQGQTTGSVIVSANPAGLSQGVYDGSVVFTPVESGVNSEIVPVTLIVGCGQGGCVAEPNVLAVVNGASFQPGGAPRAIMTIFGTNLSDATYQATSYPLATQLGPTSVMVNGVAAPLFYVSPTQINFQMPSSAPAAPIQVVVNNQAAGGTRALLASQPHASMLMAVDPGLFVTGGRRAAALNGDLSAHTAATPLPAGSHVILFITGEGPVTPPVPDGTAAPSSPLSLIDAQVTVTIGGQPAAADYKGLAPGFAGLAQLNVIVPVGLQPGDQPVLVSINGVPSNVGVITVK